MKGITSIEKAVIGGAILVSAALGASCNSSPQGPSGLPSDAGSVGLALVLPSGGTVNKLHWALLQMKSSEQPPAPVTVGGVALGGDISLDSDGSAPSVAFGGPKGTMYVVKLTPVADGGTRTCTGISDLFAIDAGQVTKVTVLITCSATAGLGDAGVSVTGKIDNCPTIVAAAASSLVVAAGGTIQLSATATDVDLEPVTYSWNANEGTFDDAAVAVTKYHCPATPSLQTITLEVADHDGMVVTGSGTGGGVGGVAGAGGAGGGSGAPVNVPTTPAKCKTAAQVVVNCGLCGNGVLDNVGSEQCDPPNGKTCDSVCQTIVGAGGAGGGPGAGGHGGGAGGAAGLGS